MHSDVSRFFPGKLLLLINNVLDDCDVVNLRWASSYYQFVMSAILLRNIVCLNHLFS